MSEEFAVTRCSALAFFLFPKFLKGVIYLATIGVPKIEFTVQSAASAVAARLKNGIVAIILKDDTATPGLYTVADAQDLPSGLSATNKAYVLQALLPQIAAMADSHFEIEKNVEENETVTSIHPLSEEDSVRELARMLGGAKITDSVLANASEMKELAQVQKSARLK